MALALKTPVEKKTKARNHRFEDLVVDEISPVDHPAILSDEEDAMGAGFPVVKSEVDPAGAPESIQKAIVPREGEDYREAIARLIAQCRVRLMVTEGFEGNAYWFDPIPGGVQQEFVLMADLWSDLLRGAPVWQCNYTQKEDGAFDITSVIQLKFKLMPADEDTAKAFKLVLVPAEGQDAASPEAGTSTTKAAGAAREEGSMNSVKLQLGGHVLEVPCAAGAVIKGVGDKPIVTFKSDGTPELGDGYEMKDGVIQEKQAAAAPAPVVAPPTPPPAAPAPEATNKSVGNERLQAQIDLVVQLQKQTGQSFTIGISEKGDLMIGGPVAPASGGITQVAPADGVQKALEDFRAEMKGELAKLQQAQAGSAQTDAETAGAPTYENRGGEPPTPPEPPVKKSLTEELVGRPDFGIFTGQMHIAAVNKALSVRTGVPQAQG